MSDHHVPGYTLDDLNTRIGDGSVDANRLAATVAGMLETVQALATWANQQIAAQTKNQQPIGTVDGGGDGVVEVEPESGRRRK